MVFQGQVTSNNVEAKLNAWEVALYEFATQSYVDQPIKILVSPERFSHSFIYYMN